MGLLILNAYHTYLHTTYQYYISFLIISQNKQTVSSCTCRIKSNDLLLLISVQLEFICTINLSCISAYWQMYSSSFFLVHISNLLWCCICGGVHYDQKVHTECGGSCSEWFKITSHILRFDYRYQCVLGYGRRIKTCVHCIFSIFIFSFSNSKCRMNHLQFNNVRINWSKSYIILFTDLHLNEMPLWGSFMISIFTGCLSAGIVYLFVVPKHHIKLSK